MMVLLMPVVAWVAYRARWPYWRQGACVLAICVLAALAADWSFKRASESATGRPALRLPHLTARLVDLGPGTRFLQTHCPDAGYAACQYLQNYPTRLSDFLFSKDPQKGAWSLSDNDQQRRMSNEQVALAIAVLRAEPAVVVGGVALDVLRQVVSFAVDIWGYSPSHLSIYQTSLPPEILEAFNRTRAIRSQSLNPWLTAATDATTVLGLVFLLWRWQARRRFADVGDDGVSKRDWTFAGLVVAGVLANAIVCGALASPDDRFQARVIWLIPLLAVGMAPRPTAHQLPRIQP
jgi:hypothetical protein